MTHRPQPSLRCLHPNRVHVIVSFQHQLPTTMTRFRHDGMHVMEPALQSNAPLDKFARDGVSTWASGYQAPKLEYFKCRCTHAE
jgi:hypothetical protein